MDLSNSIVSLPIEIQYFPFLPTFMKYILQNSSPKLLLKLYQSCKYFYFKSKITIAPFVCYKNYPRRKEIEFTFYNKHGKGIFHRVFTNVEKLWLCDKLHVNAIKGPSYNYGKIGNEFLNKVYRNTLKELSVLSGYTLFKELEILSKSPNLIQVELETSVKNENDEPIPIEEIMVLFPQIKIFKICPPHFTMESFQKLSKFKFANKFLRLQFGMIKTEFEPISFCTFLQDNFDGNTHFSLFFNSNRLKNQLLPRVKEFINGWEKNKPKYFF